jgi:hypothetical protein
MQQHLHMASPLLDSLRVSYFGHAEKDLAKLHIETETREKIHDTSET